MKNKEKVVYGSIKNKITATDLVNERANKDFDDAKGDGILSVL